MFDAGAPVPISFDVRWLDPVALQLAAAEDEAEGAGAPAAASAAAAAPWLVSDVAVRVCTHLEVSAEQRDFWGRVATSCPVVCRR